MPQFQSRISQLEAELHLYRWRTGVLGSPSITDLSNRILLLINYPNLTTLRSHCTCLHDSAHQQLELSGESCGKTGEYLHVFSNRQPGSGWAASLSADVECLQRAVEGRASSDEEEEDRGLRDEGLSQTRSIRGHSCGKGFA